MSSHLAGPDSRPEPVVVAAKVAGVIGGIITLAAAVGLVSAAEADALNGAAGALLAVLAAVPAAVAPVIAAYKARRKVTPLADPRDLAGRPLIPGSGAQLR